jgi:tRNA(Ile)-lysidine synthetase-like protein
VSQECFASSSAVSEKVVAFSIKDHMDSAVSEIFSSVRACLSGLKEHEGTSLHPELLLAVSGGVDSMVLFDVLCSEELSGEVIVSGVLHVDHGIRTASTDDAEAVRLLCEARGVPYFMKRLAPPETGVESWGRHERYEFFKQIRLQTGADFVVTAHHQDDEIETFLFRLITGRSVANDEGLIREIDLERRLLRPFLSISKDQLYVYAELKGISFTEDVTNSDTSYSRNFIRHRVLPLLEELNPAVRRSLDEFMGKLSSEEQYLEEAARSLFTDKALILEDIPEVLRSRVLRIIAAGDIGSVSNCISSRRYQTLSDMLLRKPSEIKKIDMGLGVTAVIEPRSKKRIPVKFIIN